MANAKESTVPIITLILTKEEAITLASLCMFIGGDPKETTRGVMDDIKTALYKLVTPMSNLFSGSITGNSLTLLNKVKDG